MLGVASEHVFMALASKPTEASQRLIARGNPSANLIRKACYRTSNQPQATTEGISRERQLDDQAELNTSASELAAKQRKLQGRIGEIDEHLRRHEASAAFAVAQLASDEARDLVAEVVDYLDSLNSPSDGA